MIKPIENRTPRPPCGSCDKHGCTDAGHRNIENAHALSYVVAYAKLVGLVEYHLLELVSLADPPGKRVSRISREVREKMRADAIENLRKKLSHLAGYTV